MKKFSYQFSLKTVVEDLQVLCLISFLYTISCWLVFYFVEAYLCTGLFNNY